MSNLILFPILIPLLTGIMLIFFYKKTILQRIISLLSTSVSIIIVLFMIVKIKNEGIQTVNLSNWDAPFGITIVSDMVSALLVLTTNIIAFCCILYSFKGIDRERKITFITR